MIDLILDTSTEHSLISLCKNGQIIDSEILPHKQNLSKFLLPSIQELLTKHQISLKELSKISVGVGPGSYTGTRVSVAIAQSLSIGLSIPLYSFCSLLAFLPCKLPQGPFAFLLPSTHDSLFLLKGYFEEGQVQMTTSSHVLSKKELAPFLEGIPSLLAFETDKIANQLGDIISSGSKWLTAEPNPRLLIPYLTELVKQPPEDPKIIYLHEL